MKNLHLKQVQARKRALKPKKCTRCDARISVNADKCPVCQSELGWRKHLSISTASLGLIIAALSVGTLFLSEAKGFLLAERPPEFFVRAVKVANDANSVEVELVTSDPSVEAKTVALDKFRISGASRKLDAMLLIELLPAERGLDIPSSGTELTLSKMNFAKQTDGRLICPAVFGLSESHGPHTVKKQKNMLRVSTMAIEDQKAYFDANDKWSNKLLQVVGVLDGRDFISGGVSADLICSLEGAYYSRGIEQEFSAHTLCKISESELNNIRELCRKLKRR
ncbi:hypothetical protein [Ruegeria arenilitoris]|uniref:hypothetical protein n=1 Tax=Ruegeria arenilitoris TaxID=1173585 RepID=UPI00147DCDA1|nr:hypothetical protein [Ruegeria arenilitoris]